MNLVVSHLDGWAKVTFWSQNLPTLLLCMYSDFLHLFIQPDDHCTEPTWQGISTVSHHLVYSILTLYNAVDFELLADNLVVLPDH
jgi:hypothetical protein